MLGEAFVVAAAILTIYAALIISIRLARAVIHAVRETRRELQQKKQLLLPPPQIQKRSRIDFVTLVGVGILCILMPALALPYLVAAGFLATVFVIFAICRSLRRSLSR